MSQIVLDEFRATDLWDMDVEAAFRSVLGHAAQREASDLFLLSDAKAFTISMRRLGQVERLAVIPPEQGRHLLSFVKAMAGMDISENRRPQDGRWILEIEDLRLDVRINCVATLFGTDMTLRIWNRNTSVRPLEKLGLTRGDLHRLTAMLNRPSGLILVTGPTGTGKTTTLYSCLEYLNDGRRKINTLEDPVEYSLSGIRQSQVDPKLGIDFPELLRHILRQAPDVVMIGEIRDEETAATSIRAANSGQLVLATLHAPVAASAVQSMLALGSHSYFLSNCLLGIVAQRLVRTLCEECRVGYEVNETPQTFSEVAHLLEPGEGETLYGPIGCETCYQDGYAGRTGLFEVMPVNTEIRRAIAAEQPSEQIQAAAIGAGMIEFRRSALLKVAQGITTTEDILRDVPLKYLVPDD